MRCAGRKAASAPVPPRAQLGSGTASTTWSAVTFAKEMASRPVVGIQGVAAQGGPPFGVRLRNVTTTGFEWRLEGAGGAAPAASTVYYFAAEEGVYTVAADGWKGEVIRYTETNTWPKTDRATSRGTALHSLWTQSFTTPVAIAQEQTPGDKLSWMEGGANDNGLNLENPTGSEFWLGRGIGGDTDTTRAATEVGVITFEAGAGTVGVHAFHAGVIADIIEGPDNDPSGYAGAIGGSLTNVTHAFMGPHGLDGSDGGWAMLLDPTSGDALSDSSLRVIYFEDQWEDAELSHATELAGYVAFTSPETPVAVTAMAVANGTDGTSLIASWTDPSFGGFTDVVVRAKAGSYPTSATDGTAGAVATAGDETVRVSGLTNGVLYYVAAFARSIDGSTADGDTAGERATGTPSDTAPGPVTSLVAEGSGDDDVVLTWVNPAGLSDLDAIIIRRAEGATAPATPTAGDAVYSATGTTTTDTATTGGTEYSYAVFVRDSAGNHSTAVTVTVNAGEGNWSTQAFDLDGASLWLQSRPFRRSSDAGGFSGTNGTIWWTVRMWVNIRDTATAYLFSSSGGSHNGTSLLWPVWAVRIAAGNWETLVINNANVTARRCTTNIPVTLGWHSFTWTVRVSGSGNIPAYNSETEAWSGQYLTIDGARVDLSNVSGNGQVFSSNFDDDGNMIVGKDPRYNQGSYLDGQVAQWSVAFHGTTQPSAADLDADAVAHRGGAGKSFTVDDRDLALGADGFWTPDNFNDTSDEITNIGTDTSVFDRVELNNGSVSDIVTAAPGA